MGKDGAYKRFSGNWDYDDEQKKFIKLYDRSPFESIPAAFWWVLVTSTTVGYGDHYPTTAAGQVAAGIAMVWSLCVLALPVGVIGMNFADVWKEIDEEKKEEADMRKSRVGMVRNALVNLEPISVSRILYVALYHNSKLPNKENNDTFIGEADCS